MAKWLDGFLHNAKVFIRKENANRAYHHARTDEKSFLEGVGYAIGKLEVGDKMVWMQAEDIDQYLEEKGRAILTRKKTGWDEYEYSVQKIKELEGFKLTVFKAAGFQWSFIEEEASFSHWKSNSALASGVLDKYGRLPDVTVSSEPLSSLQQTRQKSKRLHCADGGRRL